MLLERAPYHTKVEKANEEEVHYEELQPFHRHAATWLLFVALTAIRVKEARTGGVPIRGLFRV